MNGAYFLGHLGIESPSPLSPFFKWFCVSRLSLKFLRPLFRKRNSWNNWHIFFRRLDIFPVTSPAVPKHWRNSKYWPRLVAWSHLFHTHLWTAEWQWIAAYVCRLSDTPVLFYVDVENILSIYLILQWLLRVYLATGRAANYCNQCVLSVCLYVCLSACISQQPPHVQTSQNILYMLHVAMARSSFDDNEICYFFHFFVMTSYFHIMGHMVHTICSIDVSVVLQQRVRSFQRIHLHLPGYVRLRITRRLAHSGAWGTTLFDCVIVYNDSKLWTERKVCCLWCFLFLNGRLWAMAGIYQGI